MSYLTILILVLTDLLANFQFSKCLCHISLHFTIIRKFSNNSFSQLTQIVLHVTIIKLYIACKD